MADDPAEIARSAAEQAVEDHSANSQACEMGQPPTFWHSSPAGVSDWVSICNDGQAQVLSLHR